MTTEPNVSSSIALPVNQSRAPGMLGASEAPAALGLDRYTSPLVIYRRLRGLDVDDSVPAAVQEAAEWGQVLEPVVRGKYALSREVVIAVPGESIVKDGWLRATPDGIVCKPDWAREPLMHVGESFTIRGPIVGDFCKHGATGLLQVKCRSAWQADEWEDGVPPAVEVQCRVEMAVTGLPWNDVAVLLGGNRMLVHRLERDEKLEANILRDLRVFWERTQEGKEPDPDHTQAWREAAMSRMKPSKVVLQATDDAREDLRELLSARRARKDAEQREEVAKTRILLRLGGAGATELDAGELGAASAFPIAGRIDWKKAALAAGVTEAAAEKYRAASKSWGLRVTGDDE